MSAVEEIYLPLSLSHRLRYYYHMQIFTAVRVTQQYGKVNER